MNKKNMIFAISVVGVVVIAAIIVAIGQLTGKLPIFRFLNKDNNSSVSSSADGSSSDAQSSDASSADDDTSGPTVMYETVNDESYYIEQAKTNPVKITKAKYDQTLIHENSDETLTYEQIRDIIGGEGTPVEMKNEAVKSYMWASEDGNGYAKFVFENDKLVSRAQIGLE